MQCIDTSLGDGDVASMALPCFGRGRTAMDMDEREDGGGFRYNKRWTARWFILISDRRPQARLVIISSFLDRY